MTKMKFSIPEYGIMFSTLSMMVQRISVAVGNVFFVLAILCMFWHLYREGFQSLRTLDKKLLCAFGVFAICFIPSVIFSVNFMDSIRWFFNNVIYRPMAFFVLLLLANDIRLLKKAFIAVVIGFNIEGLYSIACVFLTGEHRVGGFGGSLLAYACCVCMFLSIYVVQACDEFFSKEERIFTLINIAISCLGVIASGSRGGWILFGLMIVLMGAYYFIKDWKKLCAVVLLTFMAGGVVWSNDWMQDRFKSIGAFNDASITARFYVYQHGYEMFKDNPVTGIGGGTWRYVYPKYYKKTDPLYLAHSHNNVIQLMAETGFIGLFGYIFLMLTFFWKNLKRMLQRFNPFRLMILGLLVAFNAYGIFEYTFILTLVMRTFWYLLAMLTIFADEYDKKCNFV